MFSLSIFDRIHIFFLFTFLFLLLPFTLILQAQPLPVVAPEEVGMDSRSLANADRVIEEAIEAGETPGAVLAVVRNGKIALRKAYGIRQDIPENVPMTENTIFDLASMTKPIATATAVMQLVEQGEIRLTDRAAAYLPGFSDWQPEDGSASAITITHLLTHTSGMPSYPPVEHLIASADSSTRLDVTSNWLDQTERRSAPGQSFTYSCPNFVTLQRIVESVTGMTLSEYTRQEIFEPLGMHWTSYNPPLEWKQQMAPTGLAELHEELPFTVHDPFARELMNGNSGNAGLFSTADDLAIFAAMMMNGGRWNGHRILSKASIQAMTRVPEGLESHGRGLGWDLNSSYSSNQGDLFGPNTFGHTGFAGTSFILDPDMDTAVILLTNRVYPNGGGGSVVRLRSLVANIVAASVLE